MIKSEFLNAIELYKKGGESITLMMIDMDNFKMVNDTYGHSAGDETLKTLATLLRQSITAKSASLGRWGGEEFVIILKGMTDDEAVGFAEKLRKAVAEADFGEVGKITCSIGLSRLNDNDTFEDVFDRMDRAMYNSKETGKNRVTML